MTKFLKLAFLLACLVLGQVGCRSSFPAAEQGGADDFGPFGVIRNPLLWGAESEEPRSAVPHRVVATWVDTVRQQAGTKPERGFGGRLYFYDQAADPITVDGRLVVYAFDEANRLPTDHKPTRRYVFPAEQFELHMSESEIGPSYSVWLPWGNVLEPSTEVSLIARFEPSAGGGLIVSDPARQRLPGQGGALLPIEGEQLAKKTLSPPIKQTGFESPASSPRIAAAEPRKRLTTTTIRLQR